ncbi:MAG TPA: hypothetical protein VNF72_02925 [Myxococcota bacterium]|jgi:cation diffusion facilitator CzcD-associated flavoprotein CzcO|nr:hypothetical protein [Myxococcota bacterium]
MASDRTDHETSGAAGDQPPERIKYPVNHIVGIINTDTEAARAVKALRAGGFLDSEVHVAAGQAEADALHAQTGRTGLADLAIRFAELLGVSDDEMETKARYEQAMRDGRFVFVIDAPTEDRQHQAAKILSEHGAHTVNYMGRLARTEIIPPSSEQRL